jgi:hypothetical protein
MQPPLASECDTCMFLTHNQLGERVCGKHRVRLPALDWSIVCSDWAAEGGVMTMTDLEAGVLYYYSSAQDVRAPFATFLLLANVILNARIREDETHGWVIYPRQDSLYCPPDGALVTIVVDGRKCRFQARKTAREIASELVPAPDGWGRQRHVRQAYQLVSLESPTLLADWLDTLVDLPRLMADSLAPSVFVFCEVLDQGALYQLHADLLTYEAYLR